MSEPDLGSSIEANPADVAEQSETPTRDRAAAGTPTVPFEVNPADAVEQATAASPGEHDAARDLPLESDPADAAEQAVVVELDEDEHR